MAKRKLLNPADEESTHLSHQILRANALLDHLMFSLARFQKLLPFKEEQDLAHGLDDYLCLLILVINAEISLAKWRVRLYGVRHGWRTTRMLLTRATKRLDKYVKECESRDIAYDVSQPRHVCRQILKERTDQQCRVTKKVSRQRSG